MSSMRRIRLSTSRVVFQCLNYTFYALFTFICIYPFWYILVFSLSDPAAVKARVPYLLPIQFSLSNFTSMLKIEGLLQALSVSVARTVIGTLLTVFASALLGFLFSKQEMPLRKLVYRFMLVTMYVGGGLIPTFLVYRSYNLLNNFLVYILPSIVAPFNVILVKTFIEQTPIELQEAAAIDGASYFRVFASIILPLSLPILATITVFAAVGQWNSWWDNHIYASSNANLKTLQYLLYKYLQEAELIAERMKHTLYEAKGMDSTSAITPKGIRMTVTILTCLPIFMVYPFVQKYLAGGIMIGAIKG